MYTTAKQVKSYTHMNTMKNRGDNMQYIRFGEVPQNEKSVNFLKLTFDQQDDFSFACDMVGYDEAVKRLPESCFEPGISAFEAVDGMPDLLNMRLVSSLSNRLEDSAYLVEGEEVGRGNDGEPLLKNVKIIRKLEYTEEQLSEHILDVLRENFQNIQKEKYCSRRLYTSWSDALGYVHSFGKWSFSNPVAGFDEKTGYRKG